MHGAAQAGLRHRAYKWPACCAPKRTVRRIPCRQFFSYGGSRAVDVAGLERPETVNHFSVAANVRSIRSTLRSSARSRHLDAVRNVCNRLLTVVNSMYPACGQEALACVRRLLEVLEISPCPRSGAKHRL